MARFCLVLLFFYFPTKESKDQVHNSPGARFSKVSIINGPGKLSPFTLKIEVSIVLHLTR